MTDCPPHRRAGPRLIRRASSQRLGRTDCGVGVGPGRRFAAMDVVEDAAFQAQARIWHQGSRADRSRRKAMQKLASVDAIKKNGPRLECRTDAPTGPAEAVDVLTKTLRRSAARRTMRRPARASWRCTDPGSTPAEDYAGMFLDELRRHPTRDLIRDTAALVSNEAFRAALISNDGINVLLPLAQWTRRLANAAERCPRRRRRRRAAAAPPISSKAAAKAIARARLRGSHPRRRFLIISARRTRRRSSARGRRRAGRPRGAAGRGRRARERACGLVKEMTQLRSDLRWRRRRASQVAGKRRGRAGTRRGARNTPFVRRGDAVQRFVDLDTAPKMLGAMRAGRTTTSWQARAPGSSRACPAATALGSPRCSRRRRRSAAACRRRWTISSRI